MYQCIATSIEGFVQQLAVAYVTHGYWFYVTGRVPEHKRPDDVDAKLVAKYRIDITKWSRLRRKRAGQANLQYLRHDRYFVILATHGQHPFFEEEGGQIRDIRKVSLKYGGYSVSYRGGHPHVRIEGEQYQLLKAVLVEHAIRRSTEELRATFRWMPFEPYAPVRRQVLNLWRAVNKARVAAGLARVPVESLRLRRHIVKPFGESVAGHLGERESGLVTPMLPPIAPRSELSDPCRGVGRELGRDLLISQPFRM